MEAATPSKAPARKTPAREAWAAIFELFGRYKPTMLNDEDEADFCDPFGFCQGTLSQIEFAGGAIVRF